MRTETTTLVDSTRGLKFTESPRWRDGRLAFLDIHDKAIKSVTLEGEVSTLLNLAFLPNSFGFTSDGSFMVGDALQRVIYRSGGTGLQVLADLSALTTFCLSDGIVDARDRLYVGDIGYNFFDHSATPAETCVIVLVCPDGRASVVADKLFFPNGMVITPDGRTLIVGETLGHRLTAFDIREDGSLTNRRLWAQLPGDVTPDGICLDAEGAVWVANPEGRNKVIRVREGGEITHRIDVATKAYAVMLGGPERRHLFVCTSRTHDPAKIHESPSAAIEIVETDVAGAGFP